MDQSGALADTLSKTTSLLGGLIQQIDGSAPQPASEGGLFSDILSQNQSLDSSFIPTAIQTTATNSSSIDTTYSSSLASPSIIQNLNTLSATLHQTLEALHAQNAPSNSNTQLSGQNSQTTQNSNSQSSTHSAQSETINPGVSSTSISAQTSGTGSNTAFGSKTSVSVFTKAITNTSLSKNATVDTSTTSLSASSPADAQTLSDIITELLALTQLMVKNLEADKIASNGNTAITPVATATQTVAGATLAAGSSGSEQSGDVIGIAQDASAPTDPLLQLIAALEKTTQALPSNSADASQSSLIAMSPENMATLEANVSNLATDILAAFGKNIGLQTATPTQSTSSASVTAELEVLDKGLKNVLASLQVQKTVAVAPPLKVASPAASPDIMSTPVLPNILLAATPTSSSTKSLASVETEKVSSSPNTWQAENAASSAIVPKQTTDISAAQMPVTTSATLIDGSGKNGVGANFNEDANSFNGGNAASSLNPLNSGVTAEGAQASGTYSFASTLSALRATNGGSMGLPSVVDQVILQMNRSVKNGSDQMSVQLTPGDLGKITVKLDITNEGKVQGTVTAENPQTLGMLQKDSRSLERALQDAGLRADPGSLQFNLGGQGGQNAGNTGHNTGLKNASGNADGTISAEDTSGLVDLGVMPETYYLTPNSVNIQV